MDLSGSRFETQVGQHCRSPKCDAAVIWCTTEGRKDMLVDATPTPYRPGEDYGNVQLVDIPGNLRPVARVLKPAQAFGRQGTLHVSHFATCPDAKRFRKGGYER